MNQLQKILVIVGPTASGKTGLALELAQRIDGEVISADSRQVYRGLDIGTEKVTEEEMQGVPHHLIDIREPDDPYTAADFVCDADRAITESAARGKVPIVAGGTLFYVDALLGNISLADVPQNQTLRAELETLSTDALLTRLAVLDSARADVIDPHNRRRLIRAIEILETHGTMPAHETKPRYNALVIGIDVERDVLRKRIVERLNATLERGLIEETKAILSSGVTEERLNEIGLEYRIVLEYIHGTITYDVLRERLEYALWQYAKRQFTWLRSMKNVQWFKREDEHEILNTVQDFLKKE